MDTMRQRSLQELSRLGCVAVASKMASLYNAICLHPIISDLSMCRAGMMGVRGESFLQGAWKKSWLRHGTLVFVFLSLAQVPFGGD